MSSNVYIANLQFHKNNDDGTYLNENFCLICYSFEDAREQVFKAIRDELWFYTGFQGTPAMKNMIQEMHHGKCSCKLSIDEYSSNRKRFATQKEYYDIYKRIIEDGGENLYEELLSIVDHQRYHLNSFCEVTRVETILATIAGNKIGTGHFTKEDCQNGVYCGDFEYLPGANMDNDFKGSDGKIYQAYCSVIREREEADKTIWDSDFSCFYTLEEAKEAALSSYYDYLCMYVPNLKYASRDLLFETTGSKIHRSCISVRVISNKRVECHTLKELKTAYTEGILKVNRDELYDFLLSLVRFDERIYDEKGNYLRSDNRHQFLEDRYSYSFLPQVSMETAEKLRLEVKN